jgi:nucleotide-binding universal stress UspA family protein
MNRILVAIDEHEHSEKVVDFAIELAKPRRAVIVLATAVTKKSVPMALADEYKDEKGFVDVDKYHHDLFDRAAAKPKRRIEKAGLAHEGVWGFGDPAKFILRTAKSKEAEMIVVGIHGLRNVGRLRALGEVARSVIEGSPVPIVAVP